jgi:REase_DpnII-MboI
LNQRQILAEARQQLEGAGHASQDLLVIERICRNFPEFLVPLSNRGHGKPAVVVADEYDLQDILHGLLRLFFDDVRPEDYAPERAGARSRIDFILKHERIVVETKMTRDRLGEKEVGDELIVDIERHQAHPDCGALVALVYDPERRIGNRHGLESDLSRKHDGLTVRVYVVH